MDEKYYKLFITIGVFFLFVCGFFLGHFFIGKYKVPDGSVGGYTDAARAVNTELTSEQQQALSRTATAIDTIERIRGITAEANSLIAELGKSDRRSSDLYAQIRKELEVLDDYFRSINGVLSDFDNNSSSEKIDGKD